MGPTLEASGARASTPVAASGAPTYSPDTASGEPTCTTDPDRAFHALPGFAPAAVPDLASAAPSFDPSCVAPSTPQSPAAALFASAVVGAAAVGVGRCR